MNKKTLKIGIVGAGFSGTALAAALHRLSSVPIEIILIEKTGDFGVGDAYRTPFPHHLLNVRAKDMSAFEDEPNDFVNWLKSAKHIAQLLHQDKVIEEQFVPRLLYRQYLSNLLANMQHDCSGKTITLKQSEVINVTPSGESVILGLCKSRSRAYAQDDSSDTRDGSFILTDSQEQISVDKVVLAIGNYAPTNFPFTVATDILSIPNSWDYDALSSIPTQDPVLIVGTGLSMIDAVLTLHYQGHQGKIYALSRRGLLPLPHTDTHSHFKIDYHHLPTSLNALSKYVRNKSQTHLEKGGDWRDIISALRYQIPDIWRQINLPDKKRFLRHLLPYWNIHRHRVHHSIAEVLTELQNKEQLHVLSGQILKVSNNTAHIKLRRQHEVSHIAIKALINCMGPGLSIPTDRLPLISSMLHQHLAKLDPLHLGFETNDIGALKDSLGKPSSHCFALGSLRKGCVWECTAVPELRKQAFALAKHLLEI